MKKQFKFTGGEWEFSNGSIWGTSPLNARVRIANVLTHLPINGIDTEANGRLMTASPKLFNILNEIGECGEISEIQEIWDLKVKPLMNEIFGE